MPGIRAGHVELADRGDLFVIVTGGIARGDFNEKVAQLRAATGDDGVVSFAIGAFWSDGTVDMTTAEVKTLHEADGTVDSDVAVSDGIVYFSVRNADGEHFCGVSLTDGSLYQGAESENHDPGGRNQGADTTAAESIE